MISSIANTAMESTSIIFMVNKLNNYFRRMY